MYTTNEEGILNNYAAEPAVYFADIFVRCAVACLRCFNVSDRVGCQLTSWRIDNGNTLPKHFQTLHQTVPSNPS